MLVSVKIYLVRPENNELQGQTILVFSQGKTQISRSVRYTHITYTYKYIYLYKFI